MSVREQVNPNLLDSWLVDKLECFISERVTYTPKRDTSLKLGLGLSRRVQPIHNDVTERFENTIYNLKYGSN